MLEAECHTQTQPNTHISIPITSLLIAFISDYIVCYFIDCGVLANSEFILELVTLGI